MGRLALGRAVATILTELDEEVDETAFFDTKAHSWALFALALRV